jgi:hypothetical protein
MVNFSVHYITLKVVMFVVVYFKLFVTCNSIMLCVTSCYVKFVTLCMAVSTVCHVMFYVSVTLVKFVTFFGHTEPKLVANEDPSWK